MQPIKITDVQQYMPDRWSEVTIGQLMQIENGDADDELFLLSVLSGVDYKTVVHSTLLEDDVYQAVQFIYNGAPDWKALSVPSHLIINGKLCKVPRVDKVTLGQHIMVAQLLEKSLTDVLITIMATYFQPLVDGVKFDRDRVPEVEKMIAKVPAVEGWPVAYFFLRSTPNLKRITDQGYLRVKKTRSV